ncbi:ATP-binding protein [Streptomyces sp. NPDC057682]|uniref:ATP-binding protein n=1 Tax=unclassified Streptomyces TaxID=2593676 RepID=UPI003657484C
MSLPLTRRIARTALLLAAGAAPVVGAAGAAGAAELAPDLGGLTSVEGAGLGQAVNGAAGDVAGPAGAKVVDTALPVAGKTLGEAGKQAAPAAAGVGKTVQGGAADALGGAAKGAPAGGQLMGGLPIGG